MPVEEYTQEDLNQLIKEAERAGIVKDVRDQLPRTGHWPTHKSSDILGQCVHQNGSANFKNWLGTAQYHTSPNNHITPGRPLPTTVYDVMIPDDVNLPALITGDFLERMYSQADASQPGDENRHLLAILVMGGFRGPGYKGYARAPSVHQMRCLELVTAWLQHLFGYGDEGLFGHFNFGKASCPGYWGMDWLEMRRADVVGLDTIKAWQEALLIWNENALPKYGADGDWGGESKFWLRKFQDAMHIKPTAYQDTFTELMLLRAAGIPATTGKAQG